MSALLRPIDEERAVPDLRLAPIAAAAWAGCWLGTDGRLPTVIIGAVLVVALTLIMIIRRTAVIAATVIMMVGALSIGHLHDRALDGTAVARLAQQQAIAAVELALSEDLRVQPARGNWSEYLIARAVVRQVTGRGSSWSERAPVLMIISGDQVASWQRLPVGARVRAIVRLEEPDPGSDVAAVARARGSPQFLRPPRPDLRMVEHVRAGLRQAVASGSPQQRALVPSLVLGDTQGITTEIKQDFLNTGLVHLTAVSGANLAIMLAFGLIISRWVGVRGWWLRVIGLFGVIIFVALCRTEPSVLRAAAMGLVALAALGISGREKGLRSLFVAMIALLIMDPWLGRSAGFALSVLASAGIVWWARRWAYALRRWLPMIIAEAIAVPLAAHLATLPVATALSGQLSMIGVLTNAVAGPFVAPATVLGFAAAGLSVLNGTAAAVVGQLACWTAQPILWVAEYGSALPGAAWSWPIGPPALAVLGVGCLVVAAIMPMLLRHGWLAAAIAMLMVVAVIRAPVQPGWPPDDWSMVACDVGQGDGLAIRTGKGTAVVIDTGPEPEPMRRCLDQLRITEVPLIILSHFHADHVGGLTGVLSGRRVGRIWTSPLAAPAGQVERVRRIAAEERIPITVPTRGRTETVGRATLAVIGPVDRERPSGVEEGDGESAAENDQSLSVIVTVDGVRILLTGDVEPTAQQELLDSGVGLAVDVLKVPHHGSARQDPDFLAAAGATIAVASAGQDNGYGHPAPSTVDRLSKIGATVLCTCRRGSVAVVGGGGRLSAVTQRV